MKRRDPRVSLLSALFRSYYKRRPLRLPSDYARREFALQPWGLSTYIRHIEVLRVDELYRLIESKPPRHIYYSSARYESPGAKDMDSKGWVSSDLVFDIDADHLPGCMDEAVRVTDKDAGVDTVFTPDKCIEEAGFEALKLYDILVYELGMDKQRISIEFSGHRGFHLTVYLSDEDEWARMDQQARRELVNYIKAVDADLEAFENPVIETGRKRTRRRRLAPLPPVASMPDIRGRVARIAARLALLRYGDKGCYEFFMRSPPTPIGRVRGCTRLEELVEEAKTQIGVAIDEQVTVDTKRLIRIPYSLHGGTGLPVYPLTPDKLPDFKPGPWLSPFKDLDYMRVRAIVDTPVITVLGRSMRLRRGESYRLPAPHAVYLLCKGVVEPVGVRRRGGG